MAFKMKLNGFSLYMRERRRQLQEDGLTFPGGWKDVANHVDKDWKELTDEKREQYRQRAQQQVKGEAVSAENGSGDFRKTSLGYTFQQLKDIEQAKQKHLMDQHSDLKRMMEHGDPKEVTFVIINFSIYGQLQHKVYAPAEVALTAFNVKDGIIDNYCSLIDPYEIPIGLGIEARKTSKRLAVPYPPFDNKLQNYSEIVSVIESFVDRHLHSKVQKRKLYCLKWEMQVNLGCLDWLYRQVSKKCELNVYSLGEAMRMLSNVGVTNRAQRNNLLQTDLVEDPNTKQVKRDIWNRSGSSGASFSSGYIMGSITTDCSKWSSTSVSSGDGRASRNRIGYSDLVKTKLGVFYHERQVEEFLDSFDLAFDGEIGCPYHLNKDEGLRYCALNITNRYAYNLLDVMITTYGITPRLMYHVPDIRENPENEAKRRREMLSFWGNQVFCEDDLSYDYRKRDPMAMTIYSQLGPNRPA